MDGMDGKNLYLCMYVCAFDTKFTFVTNDPLQVYMPCEKMIPMLLSLQNYPKAADIYGLLRCILLVPILTV